MKPERIIAVLLAFALGFTLVASPLAEQAYGALRLTEDISYELHEVLRAAMEETRLRLLWLEQATERFPEEPLFAQTFETERDQKAIMRQQFAAWGFAEEFADPPFTSDVSLVFEQALRALRDMAERGMMMCQRLEEHGEAQDEVRFQAHMWGHEYRNQLDGCDLRADELGYAWAWQYGEEKLNRVQNKVQDNIHGDTESSQEQNQKMNSTQGKDGQNQNGNGNQDSNGGNGQKAN